MSLSDRRTAISVNFLSAEEAQKSLQVSLSMDMDDRHQLALDMCRSRRVSNGSFGRMVNATMATSMTAAVADGTVSTTMSKRNTLNRKSAHVQSVVSKSPPRPSPANVVYHSDEESLKDYDENPDDSSLTEKASEMSSSDQVGT